MCLFEYITIILNLLSKDGCNQFYQFNNLDLNVRASRQIYKNQAKIVTSLRQTSVSTAAL